MRFLIVGLRCGRGATMRAGRKATKTEAGTLNGPITRGRGLPLGVALLTVAAATPSAVALQFGTFGSWDSQARRDAANAAMQAVVDRFNAYGDFDTGSDGYIDVYYDPGVPTAQANLYGAVTFGGTYPNERVSQHEVNHWLGSGTHGNWYSQFSGGVWTGPKVAALMRQFDGEGAVLRESGVHFYPYGLNFDSEVVDDATYMRNVALMYAMRQDMGIGESRDPWPARGGRRSLTGSDPVGTSGFNWFGGGYSGSYPGWSDRYFPHANSTYETGEFILRTPLDTYNPSGATPSFTFGGDGLTINNTNGSAGGLLFKGIGRSSVITIDELTLDGGYVRHDSGAGDLFQLAGNLTLVGAPTIDADRGDIRLLSRIGGTGSLNLVSNARTVSITNVDNDYTGATNVTGGTLQLSGATGFGPTTLSGGATLAGDGVVHGSLVTQSGTTVRVGGQGLTAVLPGGRRLVDDFQQHPVGQVGATPNTTGDRWTAVFNGTANVEIADYDGDHALQVQGASPVANPWRGAVTDLTGAHSDNFSLSHGETGTYFFRVRRASRGTTDLIFGLTDQGASVSSAPGDDTGSPWDEYAVLMSIAGGPNTSSLRAYSAGSGDISLATATNLEWINVWLTVDNDAKTYRVATSTGLDDGVDTGADYLFGRRTAAVVGDQPLVTFGIHEALGGAGELDDLYFVQGVDLTNPLTQTATLAGEVLTVGGDFDLADGATLEIDLADAVNDRIEVTGAATLFGTLEVTLDSGAQPALGAQYTLLTATSVTGLPILAGPDADLFSLAGSTPTSLVLTAVSGLEGDFNNDGAVDAADYTVWRDSVGDPAGSLFNDPTFDAVGASQLAVWQDNYGATLAGAAVSVPEPGGVLMVALGLAWWAPHRHRRRPRRKSAPKPR